MFKSLKLQFSISELSKMGNHTLVLFFLNVFGVTVCSSLWLALTSFLNFKANLNQMLYFVLKKKPNI